MPVTESKGLEAQCTVDNASGEMPNQSMMANSDCKGPVGLDFHFLRSSYTDRSISS